jgi:hypothetical protein
MVQHTNVTAMFYLIFNLCTYSPFLIPFQIIEDYVLVTIAFKVINYLKWKLHSVVEITVHGSLYARLKMTLEITNIVLFITSLIISFLCATKKLTLLFWHSFKTRGNMMWTCFLTNRTLHEGKRDPFMGFLSPSKVKELIHYIRDHNHTWVKLL